MGLAEDAHINVEIRVQRGMDDALSGLAESALQYAYARRGKEDVLYGAGS